MRPAGPRSFGQCGRHSRALVVSSRLAAARPRLPIRRPRRHRPRRCSPSRCSAVWTPLIKWLSAGYPVHADAVLQRAVRAGAGGVMTCARGRPRRSCARAGSGCTAARPARHDRRLLRVLRLQPAAARRRLCDHLHDAAPDHRAVGAAARRDRGWRRWSAVLVGFVGVLVMLRPGIGADRPRQPSRRCWRRLRLGAARSSWCASSARPRRTASIAFYSNPTAVVLMAIACCRSASCRRAWPTSR